MSTVNRRQFIGKSMGMTLASSPVLAFADAFSHVPIRSDDRDMLTAEAQKAIDAGLTFLAAEMRADGRYDNSYPLSTSALAGLAFMSAGDTPGRGEYGPHIDRALAYVLDHVTESGYITVPGQTSHGPMYGHGFATLFLAECYGMSLTPDLREKLSKAIDLIIRTQNTQGGWRYHPQQADADISVTICQVMALRAARNAGIEVPNKTIDACVEFVKQSQNQDGGFAYMLSGGPSAFPRSAAGVVALYSAGEHGTDEISRGLDYVMKHLPRGRFNREEHYFYGHYYAVQAMWHAGGAYWKAWYPAIRDELVRLQRPGGMWNDPICQEYGTAMACIVLQMPNNYLPIFQR
ncbi:MAG: terpene cyclase/mutase family protein [Pirellulales bacterium]|nr:terpene cyclase/mutase family protein [Pirellulales bacterium]